MIVDHLHDLLWFEYHAMMYPKEVALMSNDFS